MADKSKQKDKFDDNFDKELDFELDDFDFEGQSDPPPKNAREAVTRSAKDFGKGFMEDMTSNKREKLQKLAKASLPSSLSTEFSQISYLINDTKDIVQTNVNELKKTGKDTIKLLNKIVPENGKLAKLLDKINKKLGDDPDYSHSGPSQDEEIQKGILAALGDLKTNEQASAAAQQAISAKQHATTAQLLQAIYAETKVQRNFHYKITNNYYRKSLELQFRMMFIQKEQLELTKAGFETFKNQFETIIRNTGLPDVLKQRQSEMLKADVLKNLRSSSIDTFYKSFGSPFDKFNKNLQRRISDFFNGIKDGFDMFLPMGEQLVDSAEMMREFGISKSTLAGQNASQFLTDFVTNKIGGRIANRFENSDSGKRAIFKIKDAMSDPRLLLKRAKGRLDSKDGTLRKAGSWLLGGAADIFGGDNTAGISYGRLNLNEGAVFDGRTHMTINKIIPGYLSKIHGELKSLTIATAGRPLDSTKHELVYDTATESFKTRTQMKSSLTQIATKSFDNTKYYLKSVVTTLNNAGLKLSGNEASTFSRALVSYAMMPGSYLNPTALFSSNFLKHLQDDKLARKIRKSMRSVVGYLENNFYMMDVLVSDLSNIKSSIPNFSSKFQELDASGNRDILKSIGVAKIDAEGNVYDNFEGRKNYIFSKFNTKGMFDNLTMDGADVPESMIGKSSNITLERKIRKTAKKVSDKVSEMTGLDKKTIGEKFSDTKIAIDNFIVNNIPAKTRKKIRKKIEKSRKKTSEVIKKIEDKIDKAAPGKREELIKIKDEVLKEAGELVKVAKDEGISNAAELLYEQKIKDKLKIAEDIAKEKASNAATFAKQIKSDLGKKNGVKKAIKRTSSKIDSIVSMHKKNIGEVFTSAKSKLTDFIDENISPEQKVRIARQLIPIKKKAQKTIDEIEKQIDKVAPGKKERLKQIKEELQNEVGEMIRNVKEDGISSAASQVYEQRIADKLEEAKKVSKSKLSSVTSFYKSYADDVRDKGFIKSTFERTRKLDRDILFNSPGYIADKGKLLASKAFSGVRNFFKARKLEDLKREYFESEEYKNGNAPSFLGWVRSMGYYIKPDITIKKIFQKTREWDRKIVGGLFKFPFKFVGGLLGFKTKGPGGLLGRAGNKLGKGAGFAALKTANAMLDMLPMGMGNLVKAPFSLMAEMTRVVSMLVPSADKEKERKNSWMSRLNIFNRKKKVDEKEGFFKRFSGFFKENKTMSTGLLLTAGLMVMNKIGVGIDDVIKGVKTVAGVVSKVFDAVGKAGSYIGKAIHYLNPGNWFGGGDEVEVEEIVRDKDGNPVLNPDGTVKTQVVKKSAGGDGADAAGSTGSLVAKGAAGLFAYQAIRHPFRTFGKIASLGATLFSKILSIFRSPPIGANTNSGFIAKALSTVKSAAHWAASKTGILDKICGALSSVKDKFIKFIDKVFPSTNSIASKCQNVLNFAKSPKVVEKVGSSALKKGTAKLITMIAAASTGIGMILTAGMVIWEIGWILWYMFHDDMTFKQAAMKQLFDIDKEDLKSIESEVQDIDIRNEERLMGIRSGKQESYSSFTHSVSAKIDKVDASLKANDDAARKKYRQAAEANKFDTKGVENKFAKYTDSPYILPMPQETMGGQRADVINLNTDIKDRIEQFAQKYYEVTGKPLPISSGKRSLQQQIKLWESQAKVKYTGNRAQDQANAKAAGGKFLGYNGGTIAYPNPNNSHITGRAVDVNIAATPYHNEVTANKRHWLFDDILEEYGLKRTMTTFNNANVAAGRVQSERWHIGLGGAPTAGNTEQGAPETKGLPASEKPKNTIAAATSTPTASSIKTTTTPTASKSQVINAATGNSGKSVANYDLIKNMENKKLKDAMNTAYMEDKDILVNGVPTKIGTKSTFNYAKTLSDSELLKNMKHLNNDIKNYDSSANKKADMMMKWGTSDYNELSGILTGYTMEAIARGLDKGSASKSISSADNKKSIGDEDDGYYSSTLSGNKNYLSPLTMTSLARRTAFSSPAPTTTVKPNINFSTRTMEDVLQKSLIVQTQSMGYLKEIRDYMEQTKKANEVSVQTAQSQPQVTSFPEPVINLSRQEKFDNVFV